MDAQRDKGWFDARLARLDALIAAGRLAEARRLARRLAELARGREDQPLGPPTLAGLPRRLHAARLRLARAAGDAIGKLGWQATQGPAPDALVPLARMTAEARRQAAAMAGTRVPRLLHQIWLGDLPRPPAIAAWRERCAAQGRDYRLWDGPALARLGAMDHPVLRAMLDRGDLPGAADVARYIILERLGGIYLDADFHPAFGAGDFDDYLPPAGLSSLVEDTPRLTGRGPMLLTNALIAAPPGHPVLAAILGCLPQAMARLPRAPAWWVTGPVIFTLFARLVPLGIAAEGIIAGRLPEGAPPAALETIRGAEGLLIDWKSWAPPATA